MDAAGNGRQGLGNAAAQDTLGAFGSRLQAGAAEICRCEQDIWTCGLTSFDMLAVADLRRISAPTAIRLQLEQAVGGDAGVRHEPRS